jgi:hypothetical protein
MANTFEILAGFLDRFDEDVEGRELVELSDEARTKLHDFARGTLTPAEQAQLVELLNQNPRWVASLASEVKAMRGQTPAS